MPPSKNGPLPVDGGLDALLREQALLPLPPGLVSRILGEILPLERVRPLALLGRVAAAAAVFFAAWFAFAGEAPALAHVTPTPRIAAALPQSPALPPPPFGSQAADALAATAERSSGTPAVVFLASGALLLLLGLGLAIRLHQPALGNIPGEGLE